MEETLCDLALLILPFATLSFALYILYLTVLNNFVESKRNFYRDSLLAISEEGRQWVNVYTELKEEKKELPHSPFNFNDLSGIIGLVNTVLNSFKPNEAFFPKPKVDAAKEVPNTTLPMR